MVTINDVAKLAGVSKGTVSHVFNGTKYTSEAVKRRVYQAAKTLDYKTNYFARTLATNQSKVIGIQLDSPSGSMNLFQQKVINGILSGCNEFNYYLLLIPNLSQEADYFPIDGQIFMNPKLGENHQYDTQSPYMWLGRPDHLDRESIYYVDNDNYQLLYQLAQMLLPRTLRGILFLNASEEMTVSYDRKEGYWQAINEANQAGCAFHFYYDANLNPAIFTYEALRAQFHEAPIDTLIIDNDYMAQGVYRYARDNRLNIPDDLSVISISETLAASEFFIPSLSYVDLKEFDLGYTMACNLIKLINNQAINNVTIIESQINFRESMRDNKED